MDEVLVNRLGGLSLPRKSVVWLPDRPDMIVDVYRGRKHNNNNNKCNALQIHKSRTTTYRPSANGQVERYNRTLMDAVNVSLANRKISVTFIYTKLQEPLCHLSTGGQSILPL